MLIFLGFSSLAQANSVVKVMQFGDDGWIMGDTRHNGIVDFVSGPSTPHIGTGSLRLATTNNNPDKAGVAKPGDFGGLSGISGSYWWYRTSSTNGFQAPAFKFAIDTDSNNIPDKILVYEPYWNHTTSDFVWTEEVFNQDVGKWWLWDSSTSTSYDGYLKTLRQWLEDSTYPDFHTALSAGNIKALLFEVGSWNANTDGYVDKFYISLLGYTTDFEPPDTTAPEITFEEPEDKSVHCREINLRAVCNETCDYINFWWRAEDESYSSASKRYHYVRKDGTEFEWVLDTCNAEKADGTTYSMHNGKYYLYAAGKDLAGNWARTLEIGITVECNKSEILMCTNVPGKGLENAPGLQKPFNPKSQAGEHAGKKD